MEGGRVEGRVPTKSPRQRSNAEKEEDKTMRIVRFLTLKRLGINLRGSKLQLVKSVSSSLVSGASLKALQPGSNGREAIF